MNTDIVFHVLPSSGHRGLQPLYCPAVAPIQKSDISVSSAVPETPGGKVTLCRYQRSSMCLMFSIFTLISRAERTLKLT